MTSADELLARAREIVAALERGDPDGIRPLLDPLAADLLARLQAIPTGALRVADVVPPRQVVLASWQAVRLRPGELTVAQDAWLLTFRGGLLQDVEAFDTLDEARALAAARVPRARDVWRRLLRRPTASREEPQRRRPPESR